MARYKVIINTDSYKHKPCSKKNWENGTLNDFMVAINGWHATERSLREVIWRINMFQGSSFPIEEWDNEKQCISERYTNWQNKRCNTITYFDRLCGFTRTLEACPYGWKQGYFDVDKVLSELKQKQSVIIPFSWVYDVRQYYKGMNGCYMEITKVNQKGETGCRNI